MDAYYVEIHYVNMKNVFFLFEKIVLYIYLILYDAYRSIWDDVHSSTIIIVQYWTKKITHKLLVVQQNEKNWSVSGPL